MSDGMSISDGFRFSLNETEGGKKEIVAKLNIDGKEYEIFQVLPEHIKEGSPEFQQLIARLNKQGESIRAVFTNVIKELAKQGKSDKENLSKIKLMKAEGRVTFGGEEFRFSAPQRKLVQDCLGNIEGDFRVEKEKAEGSGTLRNLEKMIAKLRAGDSKAKKKAGIFQAALDRYRKLGIQNKMTTRRLSPSEKAAFELSMTKTPKYFGELLGGTTPRRGGDPQVNFVSGLFDYPPSDTTTFRVTVDFANEQLGGGCFGRGFVQEEIQVAETPEMAEYIAANLASGGRSAELVRYGGAESNRTLGGSPNPLLMQNMHRTIQVNGYGNVNSFTGIRDISNPQPYNSLAIAAPRMRPGENNRDKAVMADLFNTAVAGFKLAKERADAEGKSKCEIHTGQWGCGVFGNDLTVACLAQMLAARHVGVDLVFHACETKPAEQAAVRLARNILRNILRGLHSGMNIGQTLDHIIGMVLNPSEKSDL